jgi:ubiquinone/menaquinone biosynthesis C-methylase UbiE
VALHPLAEHFAGIATQYERGRPEYPLASVGALAAELRLPAGARVLDLAAGTGKFSRALQACGYDVLAVEPTPSLREQLASSIGPERVQDGLAEAIPCADASVDAVTVADAFHWFDPPRALAEIARVLRPSGGLAIVSTVHDWTGASWADPVGQLLAGSRPEHPHFEGPPWQKAVGQAGRWLEPREIKITASHPADPQRVVDLVGSFSWVAGMPDDQRSQLLDRARELIEAGHTPAEFPLHVVVGLTRRSE